MSNPDNVRKFLDLSTGHLKPSTRAALDNWGDAFPTVYPNPGGFGWFVYVPTDGDDSADPDIPDDLRAVIDHARASGCEYVLFDADAEHDSVLPIYDDEMEEGDRAAIVEEGVGAAGPRDEARDALAKLRDECQDWQDALCGERPSLDEVLAEVDRVLGRV